jgi:hypothetical protein
VAFESGACHPPVSCDLGEIYHVFCFSHTGFDGV